MTTAVRTPTTAPAASPPDGGRIEVQPRAVRRELASWIASRRDAILLSWYQTQFDPDRLSRFGIAGAADVRPEEIKRLFLSPLLDLLIAYGRTGESRYADVYLDERFRYAPHQASPEVRAAFFEEVLPPDEAALLGGLPPRDPLAVALAQLLADLHTPLREVGAGRPLRILALGDCLMGELRMFVRSECRQHGINLDFRSLYFSAPMGRSLSADHALQFLDQFPADLISASFLSYEGIPPYAALLREADALSRPELERRVAGIAGFMRGFVQQIRERTDAPLLLHGVCGLPLTRWRKYLPLVPPLSPGRRRAVEALNQAIGELVEGTANALFIDECAVTQARGHRTATRRVIPRRVVREAFFHAARLGEFLAPTYIDIVRSYQAVHKAKVLLVDFDNTLWTGVMADGPVQHRTEVQRLLRRVKEAGILLVAVSKNDPSNVRWDEMVLQPMDFVLLKISWNLKVHSIREAAQELDLGLDSFVLIDDNPVERDLVRSQLPMVTLLDATDPFAWRSIERMLRFPNTRDTEESRARTAMYQQQVKRREALTGGAEDYQSMMASLGLQVTFGPAGPKDLERVTELVQRTNQFNTTTLRRSRPALQALLKSPEHGMYVASLADKFGDLGVVLVVIVERRGDERIIDSFVMSCRAMGFELERLALRLVIEAEAEGAKSFVGRFTPTERNTPAVTLYSGSGFTASGEGTWVLDAESPRPSMAPWFTVKKKG